MSPDTPRILVIDDEPEILDFLTRTLSVLGYEVAVVETGEQGLQRYAEEPFDLVLSDVKMPGIDGIEMMRRRPLQGRAGRPSSTWPTGSGRSGSHQRLPTWPRRKPGTPGWALQAGCCSPPCWVPFC